MLQDISEKLKYEWSNSANSRSNWLIKLGYRIQSEYSFDVIESGFRVAI